MTAKDTQEVILKVDIVIIEPEFKAEPFSRSLHFVVLMGLDFYP